MNFNTNPANNFGFNNQGFGGMNPLQIATQNLFQEFDIAFHCYQQQDSQEADKCLIRANAAAKILSDNMSPIDYGIYKVIREEIETTVKITKVSSYLNKEQIQQAAVAIESCDASCQQLWTSYQAIHPNFRLNQEFSSVLSIIKNNYIFLKILIKANQILIQAELRKKENLFIDEVKVFQEIATVLRTINEESLEIDYMNYYISYPGYLNRMADTFDIKIENIKEKRKTIQYIQPYKKNIFIVHGHNHDILDDLETHLIKTYDIRPIILTQQPDEGKTIIEKFEHYGKDCAFAFVLVSPDDLVEKNGKQYYQGRPNVLFELGWFYGRYGRNKVRIIKQKDTQMPSDLNGIIAFNFQSSIKDVLDKIKIDLTENGLLEASN